MGIQTFERPSEDNRSAAVKRGNAYRTFYEQTGVVSGTKIYIEYDLTGCDLILWDRILGATSGPIYYRVRTDYSLDSDPYVVDGDLPLINLNAKKASGINPRTSVVVAKLVKPASVLDAGTVVDLDYVVATETNGNRSVGNESFQNIYRILARGSKFLVELEYKSGLVPTTDLIMSLYWEEYYD